MTNWARSWTRPFFITSYLLIMSFPLRVTVTEGDAYWVGAWWIGFVALTIAFPLIAFMIAGYPKKLPSGKEHSNKQ